MFIIHGQEGFQASFKRMAFSRLFLILLSGMIVETGAVPLNVVNLGGLGKQEEGSRRLRAADYSLHTAHNNNESHINKDNNHVDLLDVNSNPNSIIRKGCRYKAAVYSSGANVPTEESCLFCHCKGVIVVCKLRMCPDVPHPPPPGCIVVQKANKCCSQLVCHDNHIRKLSVSREQRLSAANITETLPATALQQGNYCIHEGTVYAEGSAMRSSTLCEHCFCIHGKTQCSSPQCLIPMEGCKPRYRSYASCCPTNYDCSNSNQTAVLKTTPSSTPVPSFLKGCRLGGRYIGEGEPILPMQLASEHTNNSLGLGISRCQTCFCMGGVVTCRSLACDRPIEGCRPVIAPGHCCPDRYDCDEKELSKEGQGGNNSSTTSAPAIDATSTQVYEIRFERIPLLNAREDLLDVPIPPSFKARVAYASPGGFKNGVNREQRRKQEYREDFQPRAFEDDELDATEEPIGSVDLVSFDEVSGTLANTEPVAEINEELTTIVSDPTTDVTESVTTKESEKGGIDGIVPLTLTNDLKLEPVSEFDLPKFSPTPTPTSPNPTQSVSTDPTTTPVISSTHSTMTTGKLEFIPFGVEDAMASPLNSTRYEIYPGQGTSDPHPKYDAVARQGSLIPPSPQEQLGNTPPRRNKTSEAHQTKEVEAGPTKEKIVPRLESPLIFSENDTPRVTMDVAVQTSLYNNGYYGNKQGMVDEEGKEPELLITQAKVDKDDDLNESEGPIRKPDQPLRAISSIQDFIPSSFPLTPTAGNKSPGRTYSKFGVHDSSIHRYGLPGASGQLSFAPPNSGVGSAIVPTRSNIPNNKAPNLYTDRNRLPQPGIDSSQSYDDEDASDGESEEYGSYESYFPVTSRPKQPIGQRYGVSQSPSAIYQHTPANNITAPVISSGGTKVSMSSKPNKKGEENMKIVKSKPLRKPKPPEEHQNLEDPLGFKPVVAFPFTIPKSQDKFSLGLKLSGCNIYGKMYGVGQIIQELSSSCVQCQCTEVGVQCSELRC